MADQSEKLAQFIAVTGVDEERARFYMESAAWQLEMALAGFYENDGELEQPVPVEATNSPPPEVPSTPPSETVKPKSRTKNTNSRFATIHTMNSSSEDDEEEGQAFYAGGSEHSGQQVLGPPRKRDIISDMFKAVREHGVEILEPSTSGSGPSAVFRGTGYKLGQTPTDSEAVPGAPEPQRPEQVTLKLWREGFSLDNGELRMYNDPANREFLDSIRRGEIPTELRQSTTEVHLAMEDHRMEGFRQEADRKFKKAFFGPGHTLGSPTPTTVGAPSTEQKDCAGNEARAKKNLGLDASQPTTNIQIRLADGSRLVGQFNHDHTLGQVRAYIIAARPQYETHTFSLLSTYPSRELKDSETLAEAGLLNSAIMQKLT